MRPDACSPGRSVTLVYEFGPEVFENYQMSLELEVGVSGSYTRDVHDFWRPLHSKEAVVDGHYSVQCYLDALTGAYQAWFLGVEGERRVYTA